MTHNAHIGTKPKSHQISLKYWAKIFSRPIHLKVMEKKINLEEVQEEVETIEVQKNDLKQENEAHREDIHALLDEESMRRLNSITLWLQVGHKTLLSSIDKLKQGTR